MPKRKRSIWEATGLPDDIIWHAKRLRTSELMDRMRRGVALIIDRLRPYYYGRSLLTDVHDPYGVFYKSRSTIKREYSRWGDVQDYKGGLVRDLTYTW